MMATFEEQVAERKFSFRPPRSVMKGGLSRAASAGQQATNAGIAGGATAGQMKSAMAPEVESLQAELRQTQIRQNAGEVMTKLRTLNYVDAATDERARQDAYYGEMNRTSWDEAIVKGAAIAQVLNGVAGIVSEKGTKTVDKEMFVDKDGNPISDADARMRADFTPTDPASARGATGAVGVENYLQSNAARDENGQPLKVKQRELVQSDAAKASEKVQNALGSIFPNIKRYNQSKHQATLDSIEVFNAQRKEALAKQMGRIDDVAGMRRELEETTQLRKLYIDMARREGADTERLLGMVERMDAQIAGLEARGAGRDPEFVIPDGTYSPLLAAIIPGESKEHGFNSWNNIVNGRVIGGTHISEAPWNTEKKSVNEMTLGEVMELQRNDRPGGRAMFAFGAAQMVPDTLKSVADSLGLKSEMPVDEKGQMVLFEGLLNSNKKISRYITSESVTDDDLLAAADEIPEIWAGVKTRLVPGDKKRTGRGYYDGDGLNKATVEYSSILEALRASRQRYRDSLLAGGSR